jgi:hypothetical protein
MGWLNFLYASMTIFFGLDAIMESSKHSKNSTVICIVAMILLVVINLF